MARLKLDKHDWLSLVDQSGLLISEPVLMDKFPDGPEKVEQWVYRKYHKQFQRSRLPGDAVARRNIFLDFLLRELLGLTRRVSGHDLPEGCKVALVEFDQMLKADWAILDVERRPVFLGMTVQPDQSLTRRETASGRWKATPVTKMERLMQETGVPLGLLTNGEDFRLIYAPPGLSPSAITFSAQTFADEKSTLDAFYTLLRAERFDGPEATRLLTLVRESQDRQVDVADQLGSQVREALEFFIAAFDAADRQNDGALLAEMTHDELYEMSLIVMMRLVFLLYAEENRLLPHGELIYDQAYGLTHLWSELENDKKLERLAGAFDAWPRFLATCRLIHEGCDHPDMKMLAYGGGLFDPARFPVLEDARFQISNQVVFGMLRRLLFAKGKIGKETLPQRVSYRTLDVEQIGYVYEGLLDHKIGRAGTSYKLRLIGDNEPEIDLDALDGKPRKEQLKALAAAMGVKGDKTGDIEKKLDKAEDQALDFDDSRQTLPADVADKVAPFTLLLRKQGFTVIEPHRLYLTTGTSRRVSGSHYTPQTLTADIVRHTLEPLVYENDHGVYAEPRKLKSPREILDLKICDMAMGSGAFLVQAIRWLADRLVESWTVQANRRGEEVKLTLPYGDPSANPEFDALIPEDRDLQVLEARRYVCLKCIYGVDKNRLAVEMAKLSLWLTTLAKDKPFTFLDHALKHGDSLVGVDREQLENWSFTRKADGVGQQLPAFASNLKKAIDIAVALRREITDSPVLTAKEQQEKKRKLLLADQAMSVFKLGGDLLVASHFSEDKPKDRDSARKRLSFEFLKAFTAAEERWFRDKGKLKEEILNEVLAEVRATADELLGEERPFHWHFEFPEVFMEGGRSGFDAIIGNPPFAGGQKLTGNYGAPYRDFLVNVIADGRKGSADLVSYFFLKAAGLLERGGNFGLIATNTIAQGDTREVGLSHLVGSGNSITRAVSGMPWPGKAGVHVSVAHLHKGKWQGTRELDGKPVAFISPLLDSSTAFEKPKTLKQNEGKSFQGSIVLGMGFVMTPEEAQGYLDANPANKEVLFPYLNGEDLNTHPEQEPSRWVINFGNRPLEECEAKWPELMARVRALVKPEREKQNDKYGRENWWQFLRVRNELYAAIRGMERVLVKCRVSNTIAFAFCPTNIVASEAAVVIASDRSSHFSIVQ